LTFNPRHNSSFGKGAALSRAVTAAKINSGFAAVKDVLIAIPENEDRMGSVRSMRRIGPIRPLRR
jgi:hypothetical protein